jgi:RNA polymerase sigma-70 factor (ECF subfamily)
MDIALTQLPSWTRLSPLTVADRPALEALTRKLREGDSAIVERVLRELLPAMQHLARRLLGPRPDVEDVTQEILTEIASSLHRFEGRCSIHTLAHRIAIRTTARSYRRRPKGMETHEMDTHAAEGATPEETLASRQAAARLYAHLEALTEVRRTAFVLCCIEEMTPAEAAEIVGCTAVSMRSRLFEARTELAERLGRDAARHEREGGRR